MYLRHFWAITLRDLGAIGFCLAKERTSLPGLAMVLRDWRKTWAKRRRIQAARRVDDQYMASWFQYAPVSKRAPKKMARMLARSETAKT